ncbi:valacyclovir hydrolase isoform 2-T2 [Anomaloglossus baeobatrachus]
MTWSSSDSVHTQSWELGRNTGDCRSNMALCGAAAAVMSSACLLRRVVRLSLPSRAAQFYCTAITSGRIQVNGVNLHYQRTGCGDHAVLLLPGALGCSQTDFGPQLKFLNKERFTIIGWDPRGYGLSIPPARDYPTDFFSRDAKDAVDLMQALNFKKISLLGWSDGGITALIAAGSYPSLINKLVIWGANAYVTEEDLVLYNAVKDVRTWSPKMRKPMEDIYEKEYFANTFSAWVEGITQFINKPNGNICRHLLPLIVCPTLIVHGMKDPMVPKFHPQFLHEQIKNSRDLSSNQR